MRWLTSEDWLQSSGEGSASDPLGQVIYSREMPTLIDDESFFAQLKSGVAPSGGIFAISPNEILWSNQPRRGFVIGWLDYVYDLNNTGNMSILGSSTHRYSLRFTQ